MRLIGILFLLLLGLGCSGTPGAKEPAYVPATASAYTLRELAQEYERLGGQPVRFRTSLADFVGVGINAPQERRGDAGFLREVLYGALARHGLALVPADSAWLVVSIQEVEARDVTRDELQGCPPQEWVSVVLPADSALLGTPLGCRASMDGKQVRLTGPAAKLRDWAEVADRIARAEHGVARSYENVDLPPAELARIVNELFPGEASVDPGQKPPVITASNEVHKELQRMLPTK